MSNVPKRVVIIGSGIVGASLASFLSRGGAEVRVLEASKDFGGVATPQSWAWINASWGNAKPYFELRQFSMKEWKRCDQAVPGLNVNWCGSLLWDLPKPKLRAYVDEHSSWGYETKLVDAEQAAEIEPRLVLPPTLAAYSPGEASVEPLATAITFLNDAHRNGAEIIPNARVRWLRERGGKIDGVMTSEGDIDADEVIIAAGTGCNDVLKSINMSLDINAPPGLLIHTEPEPELLKGLVIAPSMHVRQTSAGNLIAGTDFRDESVLENPREVAEAMLKDISAIIKVDKKPVLERFTFGQRPTPADGHPCLGRIGNISGLYLAVSHSGITLAPGIGKLCSEEILSGDRHELLLPFSPGRLLRQL